MSICFSISSRVSFYLFFFFFQFRCSKNDKHIFPWKYQKELISGQYLRKIITCSMLCLSREVWNVALLLGTPAQSRVWWHWILALEQQAILNLDLALTANNWKRKKCLGGAIKPRRGNWIFTLGLKADLLGVVRVASGVPELGGHSCHHWGWSGHPSLDRANPRHSEASCDVWRAEERK